MLQEQCSQEDALGQALADQQRLEDAALVARRIAHTYSNVLTSIVGFVEMSLSQAPPGSTIRRYLDVAFRGAQQGVLLTQRLRLLGSRVTDAAKGVALQPTLTRQLGRRTSTERTVQEHLDVPPELPAVALSSDQLTAVLDALLDNAHEALTQDGHVHVRARLVEPTFEEICQARGRMRPGEYVRLDVCDSGPGLSPEARQRLFQQMFFTTKLRHHGLGLTIAHSILSGQQGGLSLLDNPAGGLTARVWLPVHDASAAPQRKVKQ
jgi:signal transduction histidine kinase